MGELLRRVAVLALLLVIPLILAAASQSPAAAGNTVGRWWHLAGTLGERCDEVHAAGIDAVASIVSRPMKLAEAIEDAAALLADAAERVVRTVLLGTRIGAVRMTQQTPA